MREAPATTGEPRGSALSREGLHRREWRSLPGQGRELPQGVPRLHPGGDHEVALVPPQGRGPEDQGSDHHRHHVVALQNRALEMIGMTISLPVLEAESKTVVLGANEGNIGLKDWSQTLSNSPEI